MTPNPSLERTATVHLDTALPNCVLRSWTVGDRPALVRQANNRNVWRNLFDAFPHPYTEADADQWVAVASESGRDVHLAIALDGEAIGGVGVNAGSGTAAQTGMFGYWLGEGHWGQGIATAAARAMTDHLLSMSAFSRLEASVFSWNPASMKVLEKVGFVCEGVLRKSVFKDGELIDSVLYALVRDEGPASSSPPNEQNTCGEP